MISYQALAHYSFFSNFLTGLVFFVAVYGLGDFILSRLRFTVSPPLIQISKAILGFLTLSLVLQILSFLFWINNPNLLIINILLGLSFIRYVYHSLRQKSPFVRLWPTNTLLIIGVGVCFFPLLFYAVLPSTKIDELFYHQLVAQRIIADGGLIFYRQPWEAAIPPHLIYNFTHLPLLALGFPDAPNVVSLGIFSLFLWAVYHLSKQAEVPIFWIIITLCLACLGMYRLVFTTAASHHFGDLAAFMAFYITLNFSKLKKTYAIESLVVCQGLMFPAILGAKVSLTPFAALIGLAMLYDLFKNNTLTLKNIGLLVLPTVVFYLPIVFWTYSQTHSPFGLILSQYFDTRIIDSHLLASTLQAEIVTTPTFLDHTKAALLHFPYLLLGSFIFFGLSKYPIVTKAKIYVIVILFLLILYKFHLLYNPRFWGNLPLSLFIFSILSLPDYFQKNLLLSYSYKHKQVVATLFVLATVLPYVGMSYVYLYNLRPFPYNANTREIFYKKFIPLYDDFKALDKILPADACLYTQNRINLIHASRRIFRDSLDICGCKSIYGIQFDNILLPSKMSMQKQLYKPSRLIYKNNSALMTIYRTPNRKPKTNVMAVYELRSE
jgi:hypothetical protein